MGSHSQGIRLLRRVALQGLRIALAAAVVVASSALAWKFLTRPQRRPEPTRLASDDRNGPGYVTVAGAAVDVEVVAPDGRRTSTAGRAEADSTRIPDSDGAVDCGGYGRQRESDASCSASVMIRNPVFGAYRVVISSADSARAETITVGYGGSVFRRSGAFSVRVIVGPRHPVDFGIIVSEEGASQRSQPKPAPP
jgi:hypothetical protein